MNREKKRRQQMCTHKQETRTQRERARERERERERTIVAQKKRWI
jgi:hypothetical protein